MLYPFAAIAEMLVTALAGEIPADEEPDTPDTEPADAEEVETADEEEPEPADSQDKPEEEADEESDADDEPEEDEEADPTDERDTASWVTEVKRLRAENKKRRLSERDKDVTIKEYEAEKLKAERSKLAEVDRLKAEKADLVAENARQDVMLQSAVKANIVESVAAKLGFVDTTDAVTMLGDQFDQIVIDATGNIDRDEVTDMLSELLDEKPYLKRVTAIEEKVKKVRKAATNEPSDAKVPDKIPSAKADDEAAIRKQIAELNQAGNGSRAFQLLYHKIWKPGREKFRKDNPAVFRTE